MFGDFPSQPLANVLLRALINEVIERHRSFTGVDLINANIAIWMKAGITCTAEMVP